MKIKTFDIVELDIEEFDERIFHSHDLDLLMLQIINEISVIHEYNNQVEMIYHSFKSIHKQSHFNPNYPFRLHESLTIGSCSSRVIKGLS